MVLTDAEKEAALKAGKDVESLETLKRVMSPLEFAGQYYNDPVDDDIVEFKRDWITKIERTPELLKELAQVDAVMSIDPAFRQKQTNDFSGIVVTKRHPSGLIYVLEAKQLKVNPDKLIEEIFRLAAIYKPRKVMIETVAAQMLMMNLLRNKMHELNFYFTIEEFKPSTTETKAMRIRGLIPYYANGQVVHASGLVDLEAQLLEFPRGIHDDIIDALASQQYAWKVGPARKAAQSEAPYTWNWWNKRPQMGKHQNKNMKDLFGDLRG